MYQGEREVIGDLEEIVTSSQIVAQEGADAEPLVMRDKSKKKNKRRYGKMLCSEFLVLDMDELNIGGFGNNVNPKHMLLLLW